MPERVILGIGTKKGLFVAEAAKTRGKFALRGPFGPGVAVYAALIDTRRTPRVYASRRLLAMWKVVGSSHRAAHLKRERAERRAVA